MGVFRLEGPVWIQTPYGAIDFLSCAQISRKIEDGIVTSVTFQMKYTSHDIVIERGEQGFDLMLDSLRASGFIPKDEGKQIKTLVGLS